MSDPFDRKAALRAYKERKLRPGIYAVRRIETGDAWPGWSLNLDTTRNGLWIQLNQGRHLDKGLQEAWRAHGEAAFEFVILEVVEEELSEFVLKETLKTRQAEWRRALTHGDRHEA
jgi:hypothetical protein